MPPSEAPATTGIHHYSPTVSDVEASAAWYCKVFGLQRLDRLAPHHGDEGGGYAVLLVDKCEVSKRTNEGNNTWGYVQVNSAEFITWRSAIGLTRNGDLLVAAGNSLSANSLARALWSAGACYAMQLDINSPYVLTSLYFPQADGSMKPAKFMDSMPDNPARFFNKQARDFMYVTLDESNYKP